MSTDDRTPEPDETVVPAVPNGMPGSPSVEPSETLVPEDTDADRTIDAPIEASESSSSPGDDQASRNATIDEETVDSQALPTLTPQTGGEPPSKETSQEERFELVDNFARGGLGNIWLANDSRIRREVAFKELLPKALKSQIAVTRFVEEAQITGQLEHPGIVPIYELGTQANGTPYYAMKLVRGETYEDATSEYHELPVDTPDRHLVFTRLLRNFIDICNTLAFAHEHNVIHRDLKPHNIMLGQFGETLVLDWGLAKVISIDAAKDDTSDDATTAELASTDGACTELLSQQGQVSDSPESTGLTTEAIGDEMTVEADLSELGSTEKSSSSANKSFSGSISDSGISRREVSVNERTAGTETQTGSVLGTPAYMSPEQARGEHDSLDGRSDVFALGAILYRLVTNTTPYGKGRLSQILKRARDCEFKLPREHDSSIDRALEAICLRAMTKDVDERYPSALALKADVEAWLADEPVKAYPDPLLMRIRRWVRRYRTAVLSVSAVLVTAIVAPFLIETVRQNRLADAVAVRLQDSDKAFSREDYTTSVSLLDEAVGLLADEPQLGDLASRVERKRAQVAAIISENELTKEKQLRQTAEDNFERAERERKRANRNFVIASAQRLVAESKAVRQSHPRLSMLLSIEAVEMSRRRKEPIVPEALQNLHDVAATFGGIGMFGHTDQILDSAISSDGRLLLTGSKDRTARLWDLAADDLLKGSVKLTGHEGSVDCVALPAGNRWALTTGEDTDVVVWDLSASDINDSPVVLKGHELPVTCLAVSNDGRWLATSGIDAEIHLWDLSADDIAGSMHVFSGAEDSINQLCFAPSGRELFSGCEDGTIAAWPVPSDDSPEPVGKELDAPLYETKKHSSGVLRLTANEAGTWLASGDAQGTAFAWDLRSEGLSKSYPLDGHRRAVSEIAFASEASSGDGTTRQVRLATAGTDGNVIVWKFSDSAPERLAEFRDHDGPINDLSWTADGSALVTCGDDRAVVLRKQESVEGNNFENSSARKLLAHEDSVWTLSIKDGHLISGALDGALHVWDIGREEPGMTPVVFRSHRRTIREISASPDGQHFLALSSDRDRTWSLWHRQAENDFMPVDVGAANTVTGEERMRASAVAWSPSSRMAAVAGSDSRLMLLEMSDNDAKDYVVELSPSGINAIAFSSDGSRLSVIGDEGLLSLLDIDALMNNSTLQLEMKAAGDADFVAVAASPVGAEFAGGTEDGGVYVWDSNVNWKLLRGAHRDSVNDLAFSPDGSRLVSVSDDKSVRVWKRSADGKFEDSPQVLVQHEERIRSAVFGPEGKLLLTVSDDATAIVWPLDHDTPETRATILVGHESAVHSCEFSNDNRWAITGSDDGSVRLWDLTSENPPASVVVMHQFDEPVRALELITDSQTLLIGTRNGDLIAWPLDSAELLSRVRLSAGRTLSDKEIRQFQTMATKLAD